MLQNKSFGFSYIIAVVIFSGGTKLTSTVEADKKVDVKADAGANPAEGTTAEGMVYTRPH